MRGKATTGLTKKKLVKMSSCNRMRQGVTSPNNEASFRYRNSAEITLLVCEQRPSYPMVFVPAQELFGIVVDMNTESVAGPSCFFDEVRCTGHLCLL